MSERNECARERHGPRFPDLYMPAMWPLDLQRYLADWFKAWRQRRLYRRLLQLEDCELAVRDLDRARLRPLAERPLRQAVAEMRRCSGKPR